MLDARRRKIEGRSTMGGTEYPEDFDEPISEASHQTKATVRFWIGYQIKIKHFIDYYTEILKVKWVLIFWTDSSSYAIKKRKN